MNIKYLYIIGIAMIQLNMSQTIITRGIVTNNFNETIENVSLKYNTAGTTTNNIGQYILPINSHGDIKITISHINYISQILNFNISNKDSVIVKNIILKKKLNILSNIKLNSEQYRFKGITKIDPKTLKNLPNTSGGIESIIKLLPGISSNNELSNQYSVRGGSFDENLIYVNGIEIYKPFLIRTGEQEGLSFINPNMIESIEFSAGGFEAKYGDKLSSVLSVDYKKPKQQNNFISISALGTELTSEGNSQNYRFSYLLGIRIKSNQFLLKSLDTEGNYKPLFKDFQTYLTYQVNPELELSFLNYYSQNKYQMIPVTRQAKFGTITEALQLTIYFEGQEIDNYETNLTAISSIYKPSERIKLQLTSSFYTTKEQEFYDILGEYWLAELDNNIGSEQLGQISFNRGIGSYMNHARNTFNANVFNIYHDGQYIVKSIHSHLINWGAKYQIENIKDEVKEWIMIDSAGYSISNAISPNLNLYSYQTGNSSLISKRISSFIQVSSNFTKQNTNFHYTIGARLNYWNFNNELFISPRGLLSIKPDWEKDVVFNLSCGSYNQSPFFKEYRYENGTLNQDIKSQKSIHYLINSDYQFKSWGRPFKLTSSIFYKSLWDIIPFEIDNLRIIYMHENNAHGYATGIDFKLYGEFVPEVDSWISLSLLKTQEDITGDGHGYIDRPTDRRFNASIFFQDYFPNNPKYKMNLTLIYGSGLPFGAPNSERHEQTLRIPSYRRVDIGFSKSIKNENETLNIKFLNNFKSIWIGIEVFNLIGIQNTTSYIWVSDSNNRYYAVPNYLTSRLLNIKLNIKF
jgi:hypothetical protein